MKLGIIGSGMIVKEALIALAEIPEIEVVSIYARNIDAAKKIALQHNILKIFNDYDAFLKDEDIDFVYVGIVNLLHFEFTKKALLNNKNVICEKPFTNTVKEAYNLKKLALERNLFLFEAITTLHLPNYIFVKENLEKLGKINLLQCNFSQYSSRYKAYLEGDVQPAFNPELNGGALFDLNVYNIHFVVGLMGKPKSVSYFPNIGYNKVDTSGILILNYENAVVSCVAAKDASSPNFGVVQGENGYIKINGPLNACPSVIFSNNTETIEHNFQEYEHRMINEFKEFSKIYALKNFTKCHELLEHTIAVMEVLENCKRVMKT